jgi:hypothetical protein
VEWCTELAPKLRRAATRKDWTDDLVRMGRPHQRHYESRSTFRSLALAGGAYEKDLDRLTHPSPKTASEMYTRTGIIWPRWCRAVVAIDLPHRESVCPPHVPTSGLRMVVNGPILSDSHEKEGPTKDGGTGESNPPEAPLGTPHRF